MIHFNAQDYYTKMLSLEQKSILVYEFEESLQKQLRLDEYIQRSKATLKICSRILLLSAHLFNKL